MSLAPSELLDTLRGAMASTLTSIGIEALDEVPCESRHIDPRFPCTKKVVWKFLSPCDCASLLTCQAHQNYILWVSKHAPFFCCVCGVVGPTTALVERGRWVPV